MVGRGIGMVEDSAPSDHIVQFYQDRIFDNRAVCRFAGTPLANGKCVILLPTPTANRYQGIMDMTRRAAHPHFKSVQQETAMASHKFSHGLPRRVSAVLTDGHIES